MSASLAPFAGDEATATRAPRGVTADAEQERLKKFGAAIDQIRDRIEAKVGEEDVRRVKRVDAFSRTMEVVGRALIHFSFEPIGFSLGVVALWLHKQLQSTEIGHYALHGSYDKLPGAERYQSKTFYWDTPIDEEAWRHGHNVRHHQYTNIAGKDPDIHFGSVRLTEQTPHRFMNYLQVPMTLFVNVPSFSFVMNGHFTGLVDLYVGNGRGTDDFLPDRSWKSIANAHKMAFRKWVPYLAKEYLFFPLLAGPFFWKVALGNFLAGLLRDVYSAATIYCGHVGDDVASYEEGTRARGRGQWYAMQVESANNFEVSLPISMLCGALDRQIEHHLFPKLPPDRLREIAPEVRAVCAEYGVDYKTDTWGRTLKKVFRRLVDLSAKDPSRGLFARARNQLADVA